ncbi:MAG: methyltransferase domain-containing protein [Desulfobacteraceae bacterium]
MCRKTEIRAYGVRALLSTHPAIRKLKRCHAPSHHGNKVWNSSWVLMDYFRRQGLRERTRVMELGCGWGLAGIYCAKQHNAIVTSVDIDSEVFPFLQLHAETNGVNITMMRIGLDELTRRDLKCFNLLIGADICFWDKMISSLKRLINRALRAGVRAVVVVDPGRTTFDELADYFIRKQLGETLNWTVQKPRRIQGRILKIGSIPG